MITLNAYQTNFNYGDPDRYYKRENFENNVGELIFTKLKDSNNNWSFKILSETTAILNIKQIVNFNYINVSGIPHLNKNSHYWHVISTKYISKNFYKCELKIDPFMTFEMIKNVDLNEKIILERSLYSNFLIDNNKINYAAERNPHIWNNTDFTVQTHQKNVKPFSLISALEPTDQKFENGNIVFKIPEEFKNHEIIYTVNYYNYEYSTGRGWQFKDVGITKEYMVKLSPFITLLNEIVKVSNYAENGNELSHIATTSDLYVNENLDTYSAFSLVPIIYKSHVDIGSIPSTGGNWHKAEITFDADMNSINEYIQPLNTEISVNGSFTCPWGHEIIFNDPAFAILLRRIMISFYGNKYDNLSANTKLVSANAYTHWLFGFFENIDKDVSQIHVTDIFPDFPEVLTRTVYLPSHISEIRTIDMTNLQYNTIQILKADFKKDKFKFDLQNKFELEINNDILTDWNKYKYLKPQLLCQNYNQFYIDLVSNQLILENYNLYQNSNLYIQTWLGNGEQNISLYQGYLNTDNTIIDTRYVSKYAFNQPIEFNVNTAEITYALKKNYFDARKSEIQISKQSEINQINRLNDSKIDLFQQIASANTARLDAQTASQMEANQRGRYLGAGQQFGTGLISGMFVGGGFNPLGMAAGLTSGIANTLMSGFTANKRVAIQNKLLADVRDATNDLTVKTRDANIEASMINTKAAISRVYASAGIRQKLIDAEISDISNIPNQIMNSSTITKFNSMEKGQISLINQTVNETQQKSMFKFWNKYGVKNWKPLTTNNDWFKQFSLFDYFQGGDWTKYLNKCGIYSVELINEINEQFSSGVRLHHENYQLGEMSNKSDITTDTPNWPDNIIKILVNNK